jgi:hypothetical protein
MVRYPDEEKEGNKDNASRELWKSHVQTVSENSLVSRFSLKGMISWKRIQRARNGNRGNFSVKIQKLQSAPKNDEFG